MAANIYKNIKCKVFRADDPEDTTDIFVGNGDIGMERWIPVGEEVDLPEPLYNILCMAEYPANRKVEMNGQMRSESYMRPRFNISVIGIETKTDTDSRVSNLALQQGKTIDALNSENEMLKKKLKELEKKELVTAKE